MGKKWTTVAIAAVLVAGGAGGYAYMSVWNDPDTESEAANTLPVAAADVTKQTLVDTESHDGTLAYADTTTVKTKLSGTLTGLAAAGSTVKQGERLFKIDNKPVVLLYGSLPGYRPLSPGIKGADVKQFETALWALGYRGFTVDNEHTSSTARAVKEWQGDLSISKTGTVELGRVVYASGAVRVDALSADLDDGVQPGTAVLQISSLGRVATVELEIDDQRLAKKGAAVDVTLPDGKEVKGKIVQVQTVVEAAQEPDQQDTTKIKVTISFNKAPSGLNAAAVTVDFIVSQLKDVLSVPVKALLALSEGGYGVEVVDGSASHIVPVETGLFADGRVEISGAGIAEGMKVGVPG